jgi:fluoride exporter
MALTLGLVALGSALGGMARYGVSGVVARRFGETFPFGTLVVNITGCFVIGLFAALTQASGVLAGSLPTREFVIVGLCGGYTTFSSFSLQTLNLIRDGEWLSAAGNIVASTGLCLVAVWLGFLAAPLF